MVSPNNTVDYVGFVLMTSVLTILFLWWIYTLYFSQSTSIFTLPSKEQSKTKSVSNIASKSKTNASNDKSPHSDEPTSVSDQASRSASTLADRSNIELKMYETSQVRKKKKWIQGNDIENISKKLCTACIGCATLNLWISISLFIAEMSDYSECVVHSLNYAIATTARWFLYLYYIERIRGVFAGSVFAISKLKHKIIVVWFTVGYLMGAITYNIIMISNCGEGQKYLGLALAWPLLNETMISIFCLVYFIYKLRKLLRLTTGSVTSSNAMKYIMRKLTSLTMVTIFSSNVLVLPLAIVGYHMSIAIDAVINSACLLLSFAFLDYYYRRLCCMCTKCCKGKEIHEKSENKIVIT
eukprot:401274_1